MSLALFCYTSLKVHHAGLALQEIKTRADFDYVRDFIPSEPRMVSGGDREIPLSFGVPNPQSRFLVRLNNKSIISKKRYLSW